MSILYNTVFDVTYYALAGAQTLMLAYTVFLGFKIRHGLSDRTSRNRAMGVGLAALGAAVSVVGAASSTAMTRSGIIGDLLSLQVSFSIVYIGIAMVLYGIDATLLAAPSSVALNGTRHWTKLRTLLWVLFFLTIAVSASFLSNPSTYTITQTGTSQHVAQQRIFFLPLFLTLIVGAVGLPILALRKDDVASRRHLAWFALFAVLTLAFLLREATIIPSSGDTLTDLLVAFVPLTAGGFCLWMSARSLAQFSRASIAAVK